jgi:uncharacterized BrkB/YihY/UPF0761 family membrane protein
MNDEEQGKVAAWTLFGVLFGFKLLTAIVVFLMFPTVGAAVFLLVFHWFWFIPLVGLALTAIAAWRRLARVRAKRERLRRAEFSLE